MFCCVFCFSPLFCFVCSETYYYKGKNSKLSGIKRIVKKRKRIHKFSLSPIPFPLVLHMEIVKKLVYLYTLTPFYHPLPVISTLLFLQSSASQFQTQFSIKSWEQLLKGKMQIACENKTSCLFKIFII